MFGDLLSAGLNFFTGNSNRESQERQNAANLAAQQQMARENIALQREFAQSGVQWKVADANAAGIHPLAALGAQTHSFAPVSIGSGGDAPKTDYGSMGQDLSRAIKSAMSNNDREEYTQREATKLALEKGGLENEILRTELASKQKRAETNGGSVAMPRNTSVLARIPLPRPGPDRSVSGHAASEDDLKQKPEDFPQTKIVRPFGYALEANPWFNDGQQFEDRYGDSEIGSTIKFGINTIADHAYTGYRRGSEWLDNYQGSPSRRSRSRSRPWGN